MAPNLLNQNFTAEPPDRARVGDTTYISTEQGWLYLAVLIDLYNRQVVGWSASSRMTRQLAIDALKMALGRRNLGKGLLHHTDRGSQYASAEYQNILKKRDMLCTMSRKGNCYDNAEAESFLGRLKSEWVNHQRYLSRSEEIQSLFYYIEILYKRKRQHSSIEYETPQEYETILLAA